MLKKFSMRKIGLSSVALFAILLIYLIPGNNQKLRVKESLEYVRDEMISSKNVNLFKVIQICITIIGLFLLIYITLLWVSYIFDSVNTLVDVSLIGVLTLGKYRVTGMHEDEDKHEMTPQRLLIVSFITFSVSLGIFSGFIYFLIQSVMNIISGLI